MGQLLSLPKQVQRLSRSPGDRSSRLQPARQGSVRRVRAEGLWDAPRWGAWEQLRHRTLPATQGRADLGCPRRGGSRDVASPVGPTVPLQMCPSCGAGSAACRRRAADGAGALRCGACVAFWRGVESGGDGGSWPGSTRERRGRRKDSPHAGTQPGPGRPAHASSSEPRLPEVLLGFYQGLSSQSQGACPAPWVAG